MDYPVKVFEITRDAEPDTKPTPAAGFAVSADTIEDARQAARARLTADGRTVRSLSFTADGGIAAVVLPKALPVPAPRAARRSKGGQ
jgi:hypothetical protein